MRIGVEEAPGPHMRKLPSYRSAVKADIGDQQVQGLWPPSAVVKSDRRKATVVWVLLICGYIGYVVYLGVNSTNTRKNPPVTINIKEEPFNLPDVVFCPAPGDGCDSDDPRECADDMRWSLAALGGFTDGTEYLAKTLAPTPAPTPAPTLAPTPAPTPAPTLAPTPPPSPAPVTAAPVPPSDDDIPSKLPSSFSVPGPTPTPLVVATPAPTPLNVTTPAPAPTALVVLPAIRVNVETSAYDYCSRIPLSTLTIDMDLVESGDVRSLHASVYVLWSDEVTSEAEPISSTRLLINMFLLDTDDEISEATVAARLPYERVDIDGSNEFTFISNDVTVSLSQYVRLEDDGQSSSTERTYTQVTTSGQQSLRLSSFAGKTYSGALLFATFNINKFSYQSVEEVDPVDVWALLGSAGGMWEIVCVVFGALFIATTASGPDKKWGFKKASD